MRIIKNALVHLTYSLFVVLLVVGNVNAQTQGEKAGAKESVEITKTKEEILTINKDDFVVGDKNAPVTIIEYASMSCSHCAAFHNNVYGELKEKFIDTGKVKFVLRDFPLDEPALRGTMMARCAGEERFGEFVSAMFKTQDNWATKKNYLEILSNIGKLGRMPGSEFDKCISDSELQEKILQSKLEAVKVLGVRSTPTFFINGDKHAGAKTIEYFNEAINKYLKN